MLATTDDPAPTVQAVTLIICATVVVVALIIAYVVLNKGRREHED